MAARYLHPEAFGAYSAALAFVGIFRVLPDFGMAYASTLEVSRDRTIAARVAGNLLAFQFLLAGLTVALCLSLGLLVFGGDGHRVTLLAIAILAPDLVLKSVKTTVRWLLKGVQRFEVEAVSLAAERSALLACGFLVLNAGQGALAFVATFVAVRLAGTLGLWAYVTRHVIPLRLRAEPRGWPELLRKGAPFAYVGLVLNLLFMVDVVILERLRGPAETGLYTAPLQILEGLTLVPRIIGYALLPTMAALHVQAPDAVRPLYRRGVKYLLALGLPVAAFGVAEGDRLALLLFGEHYQGSGPLARVLIPIAAVVFVSNFAETTLACVSRWNVVVVACTAALLVELALDFVLVPSRGGMGAALARLVAEVVYAGAVLAGVARAGHTPDAADAAKAAVSALAFGAALWLLRPLPVLAAAGIASLVLVAATFAVRLWSAEERRFLATLLGRLYIQPASR